MTYEPFEYDGDWIECWQCSGEGLIARCVSEYACVDPEDGCDLCLHDCDICRGEGGWNAEDTARAASSDGAAA